LRRLAILAAALCAAVSAARAAEPSGCDKFAWPLDAERQLLSSPAEALTNGAELRTGEGRALSLALQPLAEAKLPMAPERSRDGDKAGYLRFPAPAQAGIVQVTASEGVWLDVIQDGQFVRTAAFTAATECPPTRKSIRYRLEAKPFIVQVSGTRASVVKLVVRSSP
jgi:hypothetical protein